MRTHTHAVRIADFSKILLMGIDTFSLQSSQKTTREYKSITMYTYFHKKKKETLQGYKLLMIRIAYLPSINQKQCEYL